MYFFTVCSLIAYAVMLLTARCYIYELIDITLRDVGTYIFDKAVTFYTYCDIMVEDYLEDFYPTAEPAVYKASKTMNNKAELLPAWNCHHSNGDYHRSRHECTHCAFVDITYSVDGCVYRCIGKGRTGANDVIAKLRGRSYNMTAFQKEMRDLSPLLDVYYRTGEEDDEEDVCDATPLFKQLQGPCGDFEENEHVTLDTILVLLRNDVHINNIRVNGEFVVTSSGDQELVVPLNEFEFTTMADVVARLEELDSDIIRAEIDSEYKGQFDDWADPRE